MDELILTVLTLIFFDSKDSCDLSRRSHVYNPLLERASRNEPTEILYMSNGKTWYAIYTRPRWEKKVSELIDKKNVETYCPLNRVIRQWSDRKKVIFEPLFNSYVFVHCTEKEHVLIRRTPGVINLVYWLKKPAIIRDAEIEMIQRFLSEYQNVKLEKVAVSVNDIVRIVGGVLMDEEGRVFEVRNKTVKVVLPSLGYSMIAELELANVRVIYSESRDYQKVGSLQ